MRTADLTGALLALWVARALAKRSTTPAYFDQFHIAYGVCYCSHKQKSIWNPHEDWAQGGPIIEREKIAITPWQNGWLAEADHDWTDGFGHIVSRNVTGQTPLIAAMRDFVASVYGETVPDEVPA